MLSLGPVCVDASGTERDLYSPTLPKAYHDAFLSFFSFFLSFFFLNSAGFEEKAELSKEATNIRNVLSFEADLCFRTTLETCQKLSVLRSVKRRYRKKDARLGKLQFDDGLILDCLLSIH